jgi:hypothetical protein
MQSRRDRIWRIGLVVSGLAALLILAASLSTSTLGTSWTAVDPWRSDLWSGLSDQGLGINGKILIVTGGLMVLTLFAVSVLLTSRRQRRLSGMNYSALAMLLTLLVMAILRPDALRRLLLSPPADALPAATPAPAANGPPVPAVLPAMLVYLISLAVAALVVFSLWVVWRLVRRPPPPGETLVARQAAQAAQTALADWQSGSPLASVIIRCYRQMSDLVAEKRAVQRAPDMTPREFVRRLEKAGVPAQPAQQLTALFELARYSPQPLGAPEEAAARACLKALAEALEGTA